MKYKLVKNMTFDDIWVRLLWRSEFFSLNVERTFSTLMCMFLMKLWGIQSGSDCSFYGVTHFRRAPGSTIKIGKKCTFRSSPISNYFGINHGCILSTHENSSKIVIGDKCGFSGSVIGAAELVSLGNNVLCGANTVITDFDWHSINSEGRKGNNVKMNSKPVTIEDNVWIGANSIILKGVKIGRNTVVGANSIVTKSLPENVIAAGNPAKVIKGLLP